MQEDPRYGQLMAMKAKLGPNGNPNMLPPQDPNVRPVRKPIHSGTFIIVTVFYLI